MQSKNLIAEIIKSGKEVEEITTSFNDYEEIPQIDIDLALSKVRSLYDELLKLNRTQIIHTEYKEKPAVNETIEQNDEPEIEVEFIEAPEAEEEIISEEASPTNEIIKEQVTTPIEPIEEEPQAETEPELEVEFIEAPEEKDTSEFKAAQNKIEVEQEAEIKIKSPAQPEPIKVDSTSTIGEQYQSNKKSIHDILAQNNATRDLASKLKDKPISDIKTAIGLNDRFLYTKELFNGNAKKYNDALDILNNLSDLDEAMQYLNEHIEWNPEKDSFNRFLELVYRRYVTANN